MEDQYVEIREYLRKQHNANVTDVRGRYHGNGYMYHYDDADDNENTSKRYKPSAFSNFVFLGKVMVFLAAVLLFSCYIYGGQDLKKGAGMALQDVNAEISKLENENDTVKETMGYVRSAWHKTRDFVGEYFETGMNENSYEDTNTEN